MKKLALFILLLIPFSVSAKKYEVTLSKCIDGDTARFILNKEEIKVRFLGINAKEIEKQGVKAEEYGEAGAKYTCNRLKKAKKIEIEYEENSDKEDKYGRTLAYVFIDDKLFEEQILKKGLAEVKYIKSNYKYYDKLIKAEEYAKNKKVGIYSSKKEKEEDDEDSLIKYIKKKLKKVFANIFKEIFD